MDVHFADNGLSTGDKVLRRESFRQLLADVQELPETQRTALLLREIDALSYEQIADAMETTVPSVKSLLVRARISLAEAAEARKLSCEEVRLELGEVAEGLTKLERARAPARARLRALPLLPKQLKDEQPGARRDLPGRRRCSCSRSCCSTKLGSTASAAAPRRRRRRRRRPAPAAGARRRRSRRRSAGRRACSRPARARSRPRPSPDSPPRRSSPPGAVAAEHVAIPHVATTPRHAAAYVPATHVPANRSSCTPASSRPATTRSASP